MAFYGSHRQVNRSWTEHATLSGWPHVNEGGPRHWAELDEATPAGLRRARKPRVQQPPRLGLLLGQLGLRTEEHTPLRTALTLPALGAAACRIAARAAGCGTRCHGRPRAALVQGKPSAARDALTQLAPDPVLCWLVPSAHRAQALASPPSWEAASWRQAALSLPRLSVLSHARQMSLSTQRA